MPLLVTNETYNTLGSLYANAGDWIDCTFEFSTRFQVGSGNSSTFTYTTTGTQHFITSQGVDFGALGFVAGDTIDISWTAIQSGVNSTYSRVIDFINGSNLFITVALPSGADNITFPTNGVVSGMSIIADKVPDAIETAINLTQNGTTSANSVIDGSTNRLEYSTVNTMSVTDVVSMVQLGDKSGGLLKDITLEYVANGNDGWKDWKISYTMFQWGVIKDGFSEPNYYDNTNCLAPFVKVKSFAQYGNPNGVLSGQSSNIEANTGGFNENFNGGINNYSTTSIVWTDLLGNVIDAVDYSNSSNFVATITQSVQNTTLSKYRIGMLFRPVDGSVYQNLNTNLGQNLIVNAPEVDFTHSTSPDLTVYSSYQNSAGAGWDLTNLQFTQNSGTLTVSGTVKPNANAEAYFSQFPDGERLTTMWVSLSNFNTANQFSDKVSLQIFNSDNIDAPIKGVQIPDVVSQSLFDHNNNNITLNASPQTTTEDDMLYTSDFRLIDNVDYEGIRTRIFAYNTVTEEEFTLENNFFSFANVVNINGQFQPNFTLNRGFNLPPTTDRNTIELKRKPSLDVTGKYGIGLTYSYLNDWRYWLAQSGVDNDFFNITQANNGLNKDWQHYSNSGDWIIRLSYYTSVNGVEDFNNYEAGIRPYEADVDVTTVNTFLIDSLNQNATSLLDDELHTMTSVNTWNYNYLNAWAEVTIEDFESGNRWVISSVLAQGGIVPNPLKPIAGETALDLQIVGNIATAKCKIDTNYIDVDKVSVSTRIYSEDNKSGEILNLKGEAEVAYSLRRVASSSIYSGACIRVRRSSDDTEQDIPFLNDVIDENELLSFTGATLDNKGYVVTWYDQSGNGNDATNTEMSEQPLIVNAGAVILASNGKPTTSFDGVNDSLGLDTGINVGQDFYESFVFERTTAGINSLSLGTKANINPFCFLWNTANTLYSGMEESGSNSHATGQTQVGDFLATTRRESLNNNVTMRLNGAGVGLANYTIGNPARLTDLGAKNNGLATIYSNGFIQELIHYKVDKSASQSFIETNTNNFYLLY